MSHTCSGCPASWTGLNIAHCPSCHNSFSTAALFDRHRQNYQCVAPDSLRHEMGKHAGEPVMRPNDRGVWVSARANPMFESEAA